MKPTKKTTGMIALFTLSVSLSSPALAGLSGIYEPGCNACRENPVDYCDFSREHAITVFGITELTDQKINGIKEGCYNNPLDYGLDKQWAMRFFGLMEVNNCRENPSACGLDGELKILKTGDGTVTGKHTGVDSGPPFPLDCGENCTAKFPLHTTVTLTATSANSKVTWGGDCQHATGGNTCDLTIDTHKVVAAAFETSAPTTTADKKFALFVTKIGKGNISINDQTCEEKCGITEYPEGATVTLTATSTEESATQITWDVVTCQPNQSNCPITMTQHQAVTVTFTVP